MARRFHARIFFCLTVVLVRNGVANEPLTEQLLPTTDNFLLTEIVGPQEAADVDDYLIQLGKAADMNVIADVTDVPRGGRVLPYPGTLVARESVAQRKRGWEPTRLNHITDLAGQKQLSSLRFGVDGVLFWREPDIVDIGRLIADRKEWEQASAGLDPLSELTMNALLKDYFVREHGWDGRSWNMDIKVKMSDLPRELRRRVVAEMWNSMLNNHHPHKWFDREFWDRAHLAVTYDDNGYDPSKLFPRLSIEGAVEGPNRKQAIYAFIGRLDDVLPPVPRQPPRKQVR